MFSNISIYVWCLCPDRNVCWSKSKQTWPMSVHFKPFMSDLRFLSSLANTPPRPLTHPQPPTWPRSSSPMVPTFRTSFITQHATLNPQWPIPPTRISNPRRNLGHRRLWYPRSVGTHVPFFFYYPTHALNNPYPQPTRTPNPEHNLRCLQYPRLPRCTNTHTLATAPLLSVYLLTPL